MRWSAFDAGSGLPGDGVGPGRPRVVGDGDAVVASLPDTGTILGAHSPGFHPGLFSFRLYGTTGMPG